MPIDSSVFTKIPELVYVTLQTADSDRIQRPLHQHNDIAELLFVCQGEGVSVCDGYTCDIHPGDFLLLNQGSMHEVQSVSGLEIGTFCFGISALQLTGCETGFLVSPEEGFVRPAGEHHQTAESLCHTIYQLMDSQDNFRHITAQHLFSGLLLLALSCPADERRHISDHSAVLAARIRQYITLHYAEALTLESISRALNISISYVSHVFKEQYGLSPVQFMIGCRIGEAQNLLIASNYSAAEISALVGYDSINHFNTIFKQKVGMPPIQYRKYYLDRMHGRRVQ